MTMLRATFELYREAGAETARALPRSLWPMAFLLAGFAATVVVGTLVAPLGLAGGFILGAFQAMLIGWYLALLEIGVVGRRRTRFDDVRDNLGTYFWETISVLFLFFIARLLFDFTMPAALVVLVPVANIVFNPIPEMIYQERSQSTQLVLDAARFMQNNWPEWLGAHILPAGVLFAWGLALSGSVDPSWGLHAVTLFGPWFQFMSGGSLALSLGGPGVGGLVSFFGMFAFVHVWMLFRGNLYSRLRGSSRRARVWQARF